jgi:hypothetical protein
VDKCAGLLALVLVLLVGACRGHDGTAPAVTAQTTSGASATTTAPARSAAPVYADPASWLCRPEVKDACESDLDATLVNADGTTRPERFVPAPAPAIDCFYVYPTVSHDATDNSDMAVGSDETFVVVQQAARLGAACKVYAPMYRQATLTSLQATLAGGGGFFAAMKLAYDDVLAAWRSYLERDNHGRGVILLGHSQGSTHLGRLLKEEVDPKPEQRALLVSAMLLGTSAHLSDYPHLHTCASGRDTGCVISYSSFRSDKPPPANTYFAQPKGSEPAICTNPAALAGGRADLHPYFQGSGWGVPVSTPFATLPGLVSAECVKTNGFNHLALSVHPDPGPRKDDIQGDLTPEWGMHLIDVSVAVGDLVALATTQGQAFRR